MYFLPRNTFCSFLNLFISSFIISECFTIIIFFFSLRYGFKHIPKSDKYFLAAALLGIIPWVLTNDPSLSVIIVVIIDLVAFIPTLKKAWYFPQSETPILYTSNVLRHSFALVAISSYNISTVLHSIAMIVVNTIMSVFILIRKQNTEQTVRNNS